ncbi:tyrosine-type recombinase/integrase [Methylocystis parvus]|uniref:tyrosine-type recombinase/integrase n=1 Tax=Methylocystis parvus TaxID=134 RepID=UPI003C7721AB
MGVADDRADADGVKTLSFDQAVEAARAWFAGPKTETTKRGAYIVADALSDYEADAVRRGVKDLANLRSRVAVHILPALGKLIIADLTTKRLREWHAHLAEKPRLARRTKLGVGGKAMRDREGDEAAERRRRSSANRTLTVLKAALNHAFREGVVASDEAWRRVAPFENVDGVRTRFLSEQEAAKLIAACEPDFAALVRGALLTGARYGELTRLTVADVNLSAATVHIRESKSGKPRHVSLSPAGVAHFRGLIEGKAARERVFARTDGREWRASDQIRPMAAACEVAGIDPPISFHGLRDTHASALVAAGVSLQIVAQQLGHADTRITEKHYAHLAPSARANAVAAHLPKFGGSL